MTLHQLILRYAAFAVLAALANLGVQRAALTLSPWLLVAMVAGTLAGLVVKYVLDKHWIFFDTAKGAAAHGRQFLLYSTMGVATTLIAWGAETGAWALWGTDLAREAGTALGLMVGYVVKFRLDRAFVFTDAQLKIGRAV